jgi:hypothetical protein
MGLPIGDQTIHHHLFVDDQAIIVQDKEDAEYMTKKLIEEYQRWGLNVSSSSSFHVLVLVVCYSLRPAF